MADVDSESEQSLHPSEDDAAVEDAEVAADEAADGAAELPAAMELP